MAQEVKVIKIPIRLSDPQLEVVYSRAAVTLNMAGQGGGKTQIIGLLSGSFVQAMPKVKQFIGANTYMQLSQSTLAGVFKVWEKEYGLREYDPKENPGGNFVVDKKPPLHFEKFHKFKEYNNIISFSNGGIIFTGSLDNYKAHEGKEFGIGHLDETKDTEEKALKDVILGRLRQYGIWFDAAEEVIYCDVITKQQSKDHGWKEGDRFTPQHAAFLGWTAWNPLYIHTSPAMGGVSWLNDMFELPKYAEDIKREVLKKADGYFHRRFDNKCVVIYSTFHNLDNLPPNFIENQIANNTDDAVLRIVYGYPFGKTGGEYFPYFSRLKHVRPTPFLFGEIVLQAWDFNAVPYMTLLCSQIQYITRFLDEKNVKHETPGIGRRALEVMQIRFYKEYCLESPRNSTEACCDAFKADHPVGTVEVDYYGDANGNNRIPGLGAVTNYKIIEEHLFNYLHNNSKKVKKFNIMNMQRRDLLNKIFADKIPTIEIVIDPGCEKLIKDFEEVKEGPKGKAKKLVKDPDTEEKYQELGHTSDAAEYEICEVCKEFIKAPQQEAA